MYTRIVWSTTFLHHPHHHHQDFRKVFVKSKLIEFVNRNSLMKRLSEQSSDKFYSNVIMQLAVITMVTYFKVSREFTNRHNVLRTDIMFKVVKMFKVVFICFLKSFESILRDTFGKIAVLIKSLRWSTIQRVEDWKLAIFKICTPSSVIFLKTLKTALNSYFDEQLATEGSRAYSSPRGKR